MVLIWLGSSDAINRRLYINGNLYSAIMEMLIRFRSDQSIILNGNLNNASGHIQGQFGTFVMSGGSQLYEAANQIREII